jgi:hypothetical protein
MIFEQLGKINASDKSYYEYIDKSAYKSNDVLYIYRVAIYDKGNEGNPAHSNEIPVLHNSVTEVKRTWGSIKDLFR